VSDVIVIAGHVDVDPEKRDAALAGGAELMRETRTQQGCLDYVWAADPTEPGRIYVFERWACQADLAAHLAGDYYLRMRDHIGKAGLRGAETLKYQIGIMEPVYDETGTPRADFFTRTA
jgi:quinol monooxygenase YgiN